MVRLWVRGVSDNYMSSNTADDASVKSPACFAPVIDIDLVDEAIDPCYIVHPK